jgi:hypothetical protein
MKECASVRGLQLDLEWHLVPDSMGLLSQPVFLRIAQLKVEVEQHTGKYQSHLVVCKAADVSHYS